MATIRKCSLFGSNADKRAFREFVAPFLANAETRGSFRFAVGDAVQHRDGRAGRVIGLHHDVHGINASGRKMATVRWVNAGRANRPSPVWDEVAPLADLEHLPTARFGEVGGIVLACDATAK